MRLIVGSSIPDRADVLCRRWRCFVTRRRNCRTLITTPVGMNVISCYLERRASTVNVYQSHDRLLQQCFLKNLPSSCQKKMMDANWTGRMINKRVWGQIWRQRHFRDGDWMDVFLRGSSKRWIKWRPNIWEAKMINMANGCRNDKYFRLGTSKFFMILFTFHPVTCMIIITNILV